jgi:predicted transcriptional regulator
LGLSHSLEGATALSRKACYIFIMAEPFTKDRILTAVEELPDDVTLDEAIEKLCFLAKVERGSRQAKEGKTVPHDEVKERLLG